MVFLWPQCWLCITSLWTLYTKIIVYSVLCYCQLRTVINLHALADWAPWHGQERVVFTCVWSFDTTWKRTIFFVRILAIRKWLRWSINPWSYGFHGLHVSLMQPFDFSSCYIAASAQHCLSNALGRSVAVVWLSHTASCALKWVATIQPLVCIDLFKGY